MTPEPTPRVRKAPIPPEAVLVVRGDVLDPDLIAEQAEQMTARYPQWNRTGVSAAVAANLTEVDALCAGRLEPFEVVVIFRRADLEASGVEIVPTFRTPHVTLAAPDAQTLIERLLATPHETITNPYHDNDDTTQEER